MKKLIALALVSFSLGFALSGSERRAEAFPGMMCMNSDGCGRCEVCVKAQSYDASGKCMKIAGCN